MTFGSWFARTRTARRSPQSLPVTLSRIAGATPGERLSLLKSAETGLSPAEAERRLREAGTNEPEQASQKNPLQTLTAQFTHTLALLLWFAAGLAFATGITALGAAIVAVVAINGVFAFIQQYRAEQVVESLMRRVAIRSRVERGGVVQAIEARLLVPGDVVHLSAGDIVPADCVLLESNGLMADLSMLTGETFPLERDAAPFDIEEDGQSLTDVPCVLPAGCGVIIGTARAVVWATGPDSSVGRIARLIQGAGKGESNLERQVEKLSRTTALIAVSTGTATLMLAAIFQETAFADALTFGTGVIVALVPEGLLPTLSVALAIGAQRISRRGAAVRQLSAVEVIGSVTVICTDKTGTLTENSLTVQRFVGPAGVEVPSPDVLLAAVLCNEASLEEGRPVGDPLDLALWRWAEEHSVSPESIRGSHPVISMVPFDAHRRLMSVTCSRDGSRVTFTKGAPEAVLPLVGSSRISASIEGAIKTAAEHGERVLLMASANDEQDATILGLVAFRDPPRAGVPEAIAACRTAGITVVMLTGDHPETARAIAQTIGLISNTGTVLEGQAIDSLTDEGIRKRLATNAVVARVNPEQKLRIVRALKEGGDIVVVTGDGVNDAPALEASDVGVAMGRNGTEVAKQAGDIVLADDNFSTIVAGIEEGRSIRANIRRFVSYVFTSNVAEMVPFLIYIFTPVPLALAVIQALAIDIGTDLLPALALGIEPPARDTLSNAPERPDAPLLSRVLAVRTFLFFGLIEAALGMIGFFTFYLEAGWRPQDSFADFAGIAHEATTLTFLAIVGGQVGCLFAQRDGGLLQRFNLRTNSTIQGALVFEVVLALVLIYVPGLNTAFSMAPVSPIWLLAIPLAAAAMTVCDQLRRVLATSQSLHERR